MKNASKRIGNAGDIAVSFGNLVQAFGEFLKTISAALATNEVEESNA